MRLLPIVVVVAALALPDEAAAGKCPNVMLVVDRSGSMLDPPADNRGVSKWLLLQAAVQRVIGKYGDRIPFGLETYAFPTGVFANASTTSMPFVTRAKIT